MEFRDRLKDKAVIVFGSGSGIGEATARRLAKLLEIEVDFEDLRIISEDLEKKLDKAVQKRAELAEHIKRLEENYDKEVFDTEMDDLKSWLVQQGIRVD